jgi:hypothetical protein
MVFQVFAQVPGISDFNSQGALEICYEKAFQVAVSIKNPASLKAVLSSKNLAFKNG